MTASIVFENDRSAWFPGETLRGTVRWALEQAPTEATLRLFWYTSGKGDEDIRLVKSEALTLPAAQETREFAFDLPLEPYSFSGKLISLTWCVELVMKPDLAKAQAEFSLSHTGQPIGLGTGEQTE